MPTKQILKVTKTKNEKRARVALSFAFNTDDPQAAKIYRGIGLCLKEALTDEEAREFLGQLEIEKEKLAKCRES